MSFPTNWDVNRYKADYESDEHWELRKAFIEAHKDKFPENELVCLAQVFTNIEFLGCKYPNQTMERVAHLSKDVAAKFRELRSGRLKRTFVGASDAASAKAKGRGSQATKPINQSTGQRMVFPSLQSSFRKQEPTTNDESTNSNTNTNENSEEVAKKRKIAPNSDDGDDSDDGTMSRPCFSMNPSYENTKEQPNEETVTQNPIQAKPPQKQTKRIPDTGFIIYETVAQTGQQQQQQSINILQTSAAKQGSTVKCDVEPSQSDKTTQCVVRIDGTVYATAPITTGKKEAKVLAFDRALEQARKLHYTIKQKSVHTVSVDVGQNGNDTNTAATNTQNIQLDEENKGFKMMKMLGWTGGSLGIAGNGIEQPISIEMKVDRSGLGLSDSTKLNYNFFVDYLTKYKTDETATYDLAFSKEFTKDERKTLHEIANRLALKSRSHNTADGSRYIVIFKKLELVDLANEILNGGLRSKCYELITPTDPKPSKPTKSQKTLPPNLQQRQANKIGFNYTQQNQNRKQNPNPNRKQNQNQKQNPNPNRKQQNPGNGNGNWNQKQNQKRKKFF